MTKAKMDDNATKMAVMAEQINNINEKVNAIDTKLDKNYVTTDKMQSYADRLDRVEKLVYGVIAVVGTAFILALIKLVLLQ